jgi:thioredoxin 1
MNKKMLIISVIVGLTLVTGGLLAYEKHQNNKAPKQVSTEKTTEGATTTVEKDNTANKADPVSPKGQYTTLANYNNDPSKYANSKKIYFFHASWCHVCQGIDKEINADNSKIPAGVTIIKTDFDSSTALRQKYGVTTQYTFVQVDNDGHETAQWAATSLSAALAGIK